MPVVQRGLRMQYGESTKVFIKGDEFRLGYEPEGIQLVLSSGDGNFPIRVYQEDGVKFNFDTAEQALDKSIELASMWSDGVPE